jgi:hypothetical protein
MRRLHAGVLVFACLPLLGCEFFPESTFDLASESRLPKWFSLPPGLKREEVTVTMSYYVKPWGRTATFTLSGSKKEKLTEVRGTQMGLQPIELKKPPSGYLPGYPSYEIITVKGVTEVIEHRRMEPIFYVTDDPAVLAELGISRAN